MEKKKIYLVIMIITLISVISVGTFALITWSSANNTEISVKIGDLAEVYYYTSQDISISDIGPIFDYETDAVISRFSVAKVADTELEVSVKLNITSISSNLKDETFKYILTSSTDNTTYTKVTEGNFSEVTSGDTLTLVSNYSLENALYFKLYIFIDGNEENPISMQGGSLEATITLGAEEKNQEPIIEGFAATLTALSQGESWESGASGLYRVDVAMDDTTTSTSYRYVGAEVNNYVSFNNDLYRIIGVFDEYSHGVEGEMLVKLISAEEISANAWGAYNTTATSGTYSSYKSDWTGETTGVKANLNVLLNEYFYNKTNTSTTYGSCSNWTYYYSSTNYRTNDCSKIVNYGIENTYQNYIEDATWYLYGYTGNGLSKENFYLCERGKYDGCTTGYSGTYSASTTEKIGLMYVSDYLYASGYYANSDTTTASNYYNGNQNWLFNGYEWTITPYAGSSYDAFYVGSISSLGYNDSYIGYGVRPAFYLKSTVYVTGGNGTFDNPFTLAM